ncbi:MAG: hypothetical protein F6K04_05985, partial [Leptolyngbya sp. SIO4C5]|nr:hypothetical protein [Leptolyngbya sp. SIO4C5]
MPNTLLFFIVLFLIGFLANSPALFGASMGLLAFSGLYELVIRTLKWLLSEKQSLEDSSPIAYLRQTLLNPIAFTLYGGGFILLAFNTSVSQGAIALFIGFSCLIIAG